MKTSTLFAVALLSLASAGSAFSAEMVSHPAGKTKIGVVSAAGATTLDELATKLSDQADKQGATAFKIIAASGDNQMHGNAIIYK